MDSFKRFSLNIGGRLMEFDRPAVMGIINVTPDSFYGRSRCVSTDEACRAAVAMAAQGARIIDIGGCSTRPGAEAVDAACELDRVIPAIEKVRQAIDPDIILSIDTFRADVAAEAVAAGCRMVNDISGLADEAMLPTVVRLHVPYVLTHPAGLIAPTTPIDTVVPEVIGYLSRKLADLTLAGVADVIVDPGFGFGKTVEQNYRMLSRLGMFAALGAPLLVGLSRKSMVTVPLGITPDDALNATTALHTAALLSGAAIIRAHDVAAAAETIQLTQLISGS